MVKYWWDIDIKIKAVSLIRYTACTVLTMQYSTFRTYRVFTSVKRLF